MPLKFSSAEDFQWEVRKIAVIGPGIVGMPMAALLAHNEVREGSSDPARVVVVQRNSPTSGWKVDAINAGKSVIGGVEPALDRIVSEAVDRGVLSATYTYRDVADADVILISVQTDKSGMGPDYGPLFESVDGLAEALKSKPAGNVPLIVFESTLAPSSMSTVIRERFARFGLVEGQDLLLGNSPNRVMPGRLVERVETSDKLIAGLHPITPKLIRRIYQRIVTGGSLYETNSMTAEIVKTLENAYRDVRIAFAAEVARYCDRHDIAFYAVREAVNDRLRQQDGASSSATAVPSGAVLVPTIGVGGHCLPKDGILLWWRMQESGAATDSSLILQSRTINDESPAESIAHAEQFFGSLKNRRIALLGTAYRFDSEDTRNSPAITLARLLKAHGSSVILHDPYVKPDDQNLARAKLLVNFTNDSAHALRDAEFAIFCVGHGVYVNGLSDLMAQAPKLEGVYDGANVFASGAVEAVDCGLSRRVDYVGLARGSHPPPDGFIDFVADSFQTVERGVANELQSLIAFLNDRYAPDVFNRVDLGRVRTLAASCVTGCMIAEPGPIDSVPTFGDFSLRLAQTAAKARMTGANARPSIIDHDPVGAAARRFPA